MCQCDGNEPIMIKEVFEPFMVQGSDHQQVPSAQLKTAEYTLAVIIDSRGYLRLVDEADSNCLDSGEKIPVNFCPICGRQFNHGDIPSIED